MAKINKRDYKSEKNKEKKDKGLERAEGEVRRKRASRNYEQRR